MIFFNFLMSLIFKESNLRPSIATSYPSTRNDAVEIDEATPSDRSPVVLPSVDDLLSLTIVLLSSLLGTVSISSRSFSRFRLDVIVPFLYLRHGDLPIFVDRLFFAVHSDGKI